MMRWTFWTLVRWAGSRIGDLGVWLYWQGKKGQRSCRKNRK